MPTNNPRSPVTAKRLQDALRKALLPYSDEHLKGYQLEDRDLPELARSILASLNEPRQIGPEDERRTGRDDDLNAAD